MIEEWVNKIIFGSGVLHAFEYHEFASCNIDRDEAVARWVIRCLANPKCEGSEEVLTAIVERRLGTVNCPHCDHGYTKDVDIFGKITYGKCAFCDGTGQVKP